MGRAVSRALGRGDTMTSVHESVDGLDDNFDEMTLESVIACVIGSSTVFSTAEPLSKPEDTLFGRPRDAAASKDYLTSVLRGTSADAAKVAGKSLPDTTKKNVSDDAITLGQAVSRAMEALSSVSGNVANIADKTQKTSGKIAGKLADVMKDEGVKEDVNAIVDEIAKMRNVLPEVTIDVLRSRYTTIYAL